MKYYTQNIQAITQYMNKPFLLLLALLPMGLFAQDKGIRNTGETIYIEKGAYIKIDGNLVNENLDGKTGTIHNDGVIELTGDLENKTGAEFSTNGDNSSTDRAVKFIGSGKQAIKGDLSSDHASLYNIVVDKANATDIVELQTPVKVNGSLVFGSATTTATYNPTSVYTNNNQKGLVKTYSVAGGEVMLTIANGNTDAIAGYAPLQINNNATTGYILTSGVRGSDNGGLQRQVSNSSSYVYPIGTVDNGFNGVQINFSNVPVTGGLVKGKFNDGTDNPDGYVGNMAPFCANCGNNTPDNQGYNHYFAENPCNGNTGQWLVLENAITDHGYWSFAADANNEQYQYVVEMFPNSYNAQGNSDDLMRTVKYSAAYGDNVSGADKNWSAQVDSVSEENDLMTYTKNAGCYNGNGVPGGSYTGFGQFAMMKSAGSNALPVELMYVKADTKNNSSIEVSWATALEINNSGFEVQRSTDGANFNTIGWVAGHNNSTTVQTYAYNDQDVTAGVTYYYQLHQIDNDGASEMSQIVTASLSGTAAPATVIAISEPMPNPARDYSRITVSGSVTQDVLVQIYDMTGRIVSNTTQTVSAGNSDVTLNVTELANGVYTTVIVAGGKNYTKNLLVSKN